MNKVVNKMTLSADGVALIQSYEKLKLVGYDDGYSIPAIGWGHTGKNVSIGQTISPAQADAFFCC